MSELEEMKAVARALFNTKPQLDKVSFPLFKKVEPISPDDVSFGTNEYGFLVEYHYGEEYNPYKVVTITREDVGL